MGDSVENRARLNKTYTGHFGESSLDKSENPHLSMENSVIEGSNYYMTGSKSESKFSPLSTEEQNQRSNIML